MTNEIDIKVVMLGQVYTGKSSLVKRFLSNRFDDKYTNTVGASFNSCKFSVNLRRFKMGIWDTAGQERYHSMLKIYYRHARAAIVCYDPFDLESFQKVKYWIGELQKIQSGTKIYIVATKYDCIDDGNKAVVEAKDVKALIEKHDAKHFETSAMTGYNVKELFCDIALNFANDPSTTMTYFGDVDQNQSHHHRNNTSCC